MGLVSFLPTGYANPLLQNPFGYIDQPVDTENQLLLIGGYRAYQPARQTFFKQDSLSPFTTPYTYNGFNYGTGNPVLLLDTTGHAPIDIEEYAIVTTEEGIGTISGTKENAKENTKPRNPLYIPSDRPPILTFEAKSENMTSTPKISKNFGDSPNVKTVLIGTADIVEVTSWKSENQLMTYHQKYPQTNTKVVVIGKEPRARAPLATREPNSIMAHRNELIDPKNVFAV